MFIDSSEKERDDMMKSLNDEYEEVFKNCQDGNMALRSMVSKKHYRMLCSDSRPPKVILFT